MAPPSFLLSLRSEFLSDNDACLNSMRLDVKKLPSVSTISAVTTGLRRVAADLQVLKEGAQTVGFLYLSAFIGDVEELIESAVTRIAEKSAARGADGGGDATFPRAALADLQETLLAFLSGLECYYDALRSHEEDSESLCAPCAQVLRRLSHWSFQGTENAAAKVIPMESAAGRPGMRESYLLCRVQGAGFGIPVWQVEEIIADRTPVPLPMGGGGVDGVIEFRGAALAVLTLLDRLVPSGVAGRWEAIIVASVGGNRFGLRVEGVEQVFEAKADPGSQVVTHQGVPVTIVDLARILQ